MTPVDLYCERVAPGLLGEPLNAATNAAIVIAAWFAWRYARRSAEPTGGIVLLIGLLIAFAAGSTLFHTFANNITRWLDLLPIASFVGVYLWIYVRQVMNLSVVTATLSVMTFVAAYVGARQFPGVLNGSIIYAPALALLLALGAVHFARAQRERATLIGAAGALLAALFFRTIDNAVCGAWPAGIHFLWHLFAALALYLAMRALIANLPRAEAGPPRREQ